MIQAQTKTSIKNYRYASKLAELDQIADNDANIAICKRNLDEKLKAHLQLMLKEGFDALKTNFSLEDFDTIFDNHFKTQSFAKTAGHELLKTDIKALLTQFAEICGTVKLKVFFGTVETDMCRRFHVDMYELRMLCTYAGPGTMWLETDNVNVSALNNSSEINSIAKRENEIRQLNSTDVAIIKGALYPNLKIGGLVHRSPAIEESNTRRLLLRVDSNSLFDLV